MVIHIIQKLFRSKNLSEMYLATNDVEILSLFKKGHPSHSLLVIAGIFSRRLCYRYYQWWE